MCMYVCMYVCVWSEWRFHDSQRCFDPPSTGAPNEHIRLNEFLIGRKRVPEGWRAGSSDRGGTPCNFLPEKAT